MCGIAGIHFKQGRAGMTRKEVEHVVDKLLLGIEPRGRHATGMLAVHGDGKTLLHKRDVAAWSYVKTRAKLPKRTRTILLHTRFATQGSPTVNANNHPVKYETTYITHNGHIANDSELFEASEMPRYAEVDSEAIAMLVHLKGLDKIHRALQELEGGFAVAAVDPTRHPDTLVLAKGNSSPLIVMESRDLIVWASTESAIKLAFKDVFGGVPAKQHFREAKVGELLYIEGDKSEWLEFKVKPYTPKSKSKGMAGTVTYADGYGWRSEDYGARYGYGPGYSRGYVGSRESDKACGECGCKKFWHSGMNSAGACLGRKADDSLCQCKQYVSPEVKAVREDDDLDEARLVIYQGGKRTVYVGCIGCSGAFAKDTTHKIGGYYLCTECWGEDDQKAEEERIEEKEYQKYVSPPTSDEDKLADLFEEAIKRCATKLGTTPEYVQLLVTDPDSVVSEDQMLANIANVIEQTYQECEEEVWQEMLAREEAESCSVPTTPSEGFVSL